VQRRQLRADECAKIYRERASGARPDRRAAEAPKALALGG